MNSVNFTSADKIVIDFNKFGVEEYDLFLKCKKLPESQLTYDYEKDIYSISAHSRYAGLLGIDPIANRGEGLLPFPDWHFQHAVEIVKLALKAKTFAIWADCGLGKTNMELEFGRQVNALTGGRSMILTLPEVVLQTLEECDKFYGKDLPLLHLETKKDMIRWCEKGDNVYKLAITNYEKMNPDAETGQIIPELKNLSGFIVDENRLKTGGGKQKWAIIKSSKGIPYKLTCTATPAPNDYIEFASQASFLERMRSENEIIWTFFQKDNDTKEWTVKKHAQGAFFEWMSAWSIYIRDPKAFGWNFDIPLPPDPVIFKYEIPITQEQYEASQIYNVAEDGQMSLFSAKRKGVVSDGKLSQIAKGFVYETEGKKRTARRIPSQKPEFIKQLIETELAAGLSVLVWTLFDEESEILAEQFREQGLLDCVLTGKTPKDKRAEIIHEYRTGKKQLLISNSKMLGCGMNLQICDSMIFSGWNDSFEDWYQAIRRAVRVGKNTPVRIHIPYIRELEFAILENVLRKETRFIEARSMQEKAYVDAMQRMQIL